LRVERALNDAYRPSVGTARRIRDLASPSRGTREQACRDLHAASVAAVLFLLESVGLPGKREEIFALLAGTPEGVETPREERKWSSRKCWP
jgi:hypothetical protein